MNDKHSNHIKAFLEYSRQAAADLLFPRRCPVCGGVAMPKGRLICPACLKQLSFVSSPACMKCGKEIGSREQEYCADCIRRKKSFTRGFALLNYDSRAAVSMAAVKYHNKREYLDFYARAAALRFGKQFRQAGIQVIVPVPVHASRLKTRGFNQAAVLAEKLSAELGIPWEELLIRVKKTDPQKSLGSAERLKNLRGAFEAEQEAGKWERVLLVDDIYTTGSTGVKQVFVFAVCIGHGA